MSNVYEVMGLQQCMRIVSVGKTKIVAVDMNLTFLPFAHDKI